MAKDVIARLKADTSQWDSNINKALGGLQDLAKNTVSIDNIIGNGIRTLTKYAAVWLSVEGAVKAFDKIVAGSQTTTDAWGRIMQANTRVVDSFFESLSQGGFQHFLSGLDDIIAKAHEAYDAVDTLGTYKIFSNPAIQEIREKNAEYKYHIQRLGTQGGTNADTEIQKYKALLAENEVKLRDLIMTGSRLAGESAQKLLDSFSNVPQGQQWVSAALMDIMRGKTIKDGEIHKAQDKAKEYALQYREMYARQVTREETYVHPRTGMTKTITATDWEWQQGAEAVFNSFMKLAQMSDEKLNLITANMSESNAMKEQYWNMMRENLESHNRQIAAPGGKGSAGYTSTLELPDAAPLSMDTTSSMAELKARQAEAMRAIETATNSEALMAAQKILTEVQKLITAQPIALRLNLPEEEVAKIQSQMTDLSDSIRSNIKPLDESMVGKGYQKPLEDVDNQVISIGDHLDKTSTAFGTMGQAMQMLNDPSAQVAGLVMQAIANVAASFAQALAGARDPWTWIAAAIGGTATMISTIAAIKSATAGSYADGGIIRGGAFAGDAIPIMANAGEVVLNAAQQQTLASHLQPRDLGGDRQPYMTGEMMYLGLNNHLRRSGKGELVTSRR